VPHGRHPRTGHRCSGHVSLVMPLTANDYFHLGGSINRWGSAPRYLSWIFDILDILVSWAYSLPLISLACLRIQSEIEWFQVYMLEWLHLVALGDRRGCWFLVTLGGCCHLDILEQQWSSNTCWWLFVASFGDLVRGIAPFLAKRRKVALVNCSCHWVTSLVIGSCSVQMCGRGLCNSF
jgi:hypothetical protein